MTHGPEYKTNGKRPVWLKDGDVALCKTRYGVCTAYYNSNWSSVISFRLPADHWANAAIEAGFEPWAGGDEAPEDWDGDWVLSKSGRYFTRPARWTHMDNRADIIGYKKKESVVSGLPPIPEDAEMEMVLVFDPQGKAVTTNDTSEEVQDWARKGAGKYLGVEVYEELSRMIQTYEPHRKPVDPDVAIAQEWVAKWRDADDMDLEDAILSAIKEAKA